MKDKTRAALYARISTREGRQHLESQLRQLRKFAVRMKWSVSIEETDQTTGAADTRPGLERLMRQAARRAFDVLVVFDLSRLTRGGPARAFQYIARLNRFGVEFWSMTEEHFRTCDQMGEVFIAIAAHIARQERLMLQARIKAGLHHARKQGIRLGRPPQLINQARAEQLHQAGLSVRQIASALKVSKSTIARRLENHVQTTADSALGRLYRG